MSYINEFYSSALVRPLAAAIAAALAVIAVPAHAEAPNYTLERIGLYGEGYTSSDGHARSDFGSSDNGGGAPLNNGKYVTGYSTRFRSTVSFVNSNYGADAWIYDGTSTTRIGLTGAGYTSTADQRVSTASVRPNATGQVAGYSARYNGAGTFVGSDAWFYNGSSTTRIGLGGAGYVSKDGTSNSSIYYDGLNDAGQVVGYTTRYSTANTAPWGQDAWMYSGGTTQRIGYAGAGYTRQDGYGNTTINGFNGAGQVVGVSERYNAANFDSYGKDAWFYSGGVTTQLGLTGAAYNGLNGFKSNTVYNLNKLGQVVGNSEHYSAAGTSLGQNAWRYSGGTTTQIGLTGAGYTSQSGKSNTALYGIGNTGNVAGVSTRYSAANDTSYGQDAWVYRNGASAPTQVGLTGAGHVRQDGTRSSEIAAMNEAGTIAGKSKRYSATDNLSYGDDMWVDSGSGSVQVGLTGGKYVSANGTAFGQIYRMNSSGDVLGISTHYNGTSSNGFDTWLFDGTQSKLIGLTGAGYLDPTGKGENYGTRLNEAGQVTGTSSRYSATGTALGREAWFYDPTLDQTFALTLDSQSTGYSFSGVQFLGEDGTALGTYRSYDDATDAFLGDRGFYFKLGVGLFDLGALAEGLDVATWATYTYLALQSGDTILVAGRSAEKYPYVNSTYALKPGEVPLPASAWMMGSGLLGLTALARRRRVQAAV